MSNILEELRKEKESILLEISNLNKQISVIDKIIFRKKAEMSSLTTGETINKKNINRIYTERLIIECLKDSKNGLRTAEIAKALSKKGHNVNNNTIRSHITRMRDKELIHKKKGSYRWLPTDKQKDHNPNS